MSSDYVIEQMETEATETMLEEALKRTKLETGGLPIQKIACIIYEELCDEEVEILIKELTKLTQ